MIPCFFFLKNYKRKKTLNLHKCSFYKLPLQKEKKKKFFKLMTFSHLCMHFNKIYRSSINFFPGSMLKYVASDKMSISFTNTELETQLCICILICNFYIKNSLRVRRKNYSYLKTKKKRKKNTVN